MESRPRGDGLGAGAITSALLPERREPWRCLAGLWERGEMIPRSRRGAANLLLLPICFKKEAAQPEGRAAKLFNVLPNYEVPT